MNLKEYQERDRQLIAMSGIPARPKGGRRSPKTNATGGTQYGAIMIPRTFREPRASTPSNSGTSPTNAKMNGRQNGRSPFRDGRDNAV